jgi:excisionase family DNA binding protein
MLYLTPVEAAERLGVTTQTIRNWMHAGTLKALKLGGRYRIDENDVNTMLTPTNAKQTDII